MTAAVARTVGGLTSIAMALLAGHLSVASTTPAPAHPVGPRADAAPLPGLSADAPAADPGKVRARLAGPLGAALLNKPQALVVDAATGAVLLDDRAGTTSVPASTLKLVTAAAVLTTFAPDTRFSTRVAFAAPSSSPTSTSSPTSSSSPARSGSPATSGTPAATGAAGRAASSPTTPARPATLWLIGGGDPSLTAATGARDYPSAARLSDLAAAVRRSGVRSVGSVLGDGSLFTGPTTGPGWRDSYRVTGNITPVSALEVDGGRSAPGSTGARSSDPARQAADDFATALRRVGVDVGSVGTGVAPAGTRTLATVASPTVPVLVEHMLTNSDDDQAEAMGRLVAHARGLPATFAGATQALRDTLDTLGVPTAGLSLADASGLSPDDRLTPRTLVTLLRTATLTSHDNLRPLLAGLPVAGFSGTLADRYQTAADAAGAGTVRAKTGSLSEATTLAGQVVDADGRLVLFAFLAPVAQSDATSAALDAVASALAGCGCAPRQR
ncbi:MAG: D-alanyl-D-alanine carboxypeptidase/D-alanyl-D-alanine endopeptidase [Frankia sp.]